MIRCGQLMQVRQTVGVQPQGPGQRSEYLRGRIPIAALLQPDQVLLAHPRQRGKLGPAQARHPTSATVRQTDVFGADQGATRLQVLTESVIAGHSRTVARPAPAGMPRR
jgi:hypothetical protein